MSTYMTSIVSTLQSGGILGKFLIYIAKQLTQTVAVYSKLINEIATYILICCLAI